MDPKAALTAADHAMRDGDFSEAREYLANYRQWRCSGGFEPAEVSMINGISMAGDEFAAFCESMLDHWKSN